MEPIKRYEDTDDYELLMRDIMLMERQIHHEIDNFGMDMSKELKADLRAIEKSCKVMRDKIKKEAVEDAKSNK